MPAYLGNILTRISQTQAC